MSADKLAKPNELKVALDTVIAPKSAYEALRSAPVWRWAFLVLVVLIVVGYAMQRPAAQHAAVGSMQHMLATSSFFSKLTDAQKADMLARTEHPDARDAVTGSLWTILAAAIALVFNSLLLMAGAAIGGGSARWSRMWAASVNTGIPTIGIAAVVLGIIAMIEGPDRFNLTTDLLRAIPNLGWLAPGVTGVTAGTLASLNIFVLWGLWLNMQALRWTAEVRGPMVWIAPAVITILGALAAGKLASFAG